MSIDARDILSQCGAITLDYKHQMLVVHAR
jgi:hypothetical protein